MKALILFTSLLVLWACDASSDNTAAQGTSVPTSISKVYSPVRVGTQPSDAILGLVRLASGEIRYYDYGDQVSVNLFHHPDHLPENYLVSHDDGLTWNLKAVPRGHLGADVRSPISGEYLRLVSRKDGVYCIKSAGGIDGRWTQRNVWQISVKGPDLNNTRPAVFIRGGKRVLVPFCAMRRFPPDYRNQVGSLYSDDDGGTWKLSNLIEGPAHEPNARDKSVRWQNGGYEPTFVELRDGRIWMIFRTSTDYHYESFSSDGGATWSDPRPSPFYATCTTPTIGRLQDGRLLFVWNNTTPLPEFPKNETTAPYLGGANNGDGEDMFNNRDAVHAAISSDDGKTWRGFRELYLNVRRNDGNYGLTWGVDRSVHQSQFVEPDRDHVLVAVGQHWLHRSLLLFDPDWLNETERRTEVGNNLDDWSVHGYAAGIRGHCALNRFRSADLVGVESPDRAKRSALAIRPVNREKVLFETAGATWNFPAGKAGSIETRIRLESAGCGARISLLDRWLNPTDPTAHTLAMCHLDIEADGSTNAGAKLSTDEWHTLQLQWKDVAEGAACECIVDGQRTGKPLTFARAARHGLSYIHYQTLTDTGDRGFLVESVQAKVAAP